MPDRTRTPKGTFALMHPKGYDRVKAWRKANPDKVRKADSLVKSAWRKTHPAENKARNRRRALMKLYGLTVKEFDLLMEQHGFSCSICRRVEDSTSGHRRLTIDHDHQTGMIRGLLCRTCNVALGLFRDDPELLRRAIRYLSIDQTLLLKPSGKPTRVR